MHLPATVTLGPIEFHLDVLASRIQRHRRGMRGGLLSIGLLLVLTLGIWLGRPWIMGQGTLVFEPSVGMPGGMQISVDGRSLGAMRQPRMLTAGRHRVQFTAPGYFGAEEQVQITRDSTQTIALPALRPRPQVQAIPMLAGAAYWTYAVPDVSGGWRLLARMATVVGTPTPRAGWGDTGQDRDPHMTIHLHDQGMERLLMLETHAVADEIHLATGERFSAVWEPVDDQRTEDAVGYLRVDSPIASSTISTTERITGIWWSPGGTQVLIADAGRLGQNLHLVGIRELHARGERAMHDTIATMAGEVVSVQWNPHGRGVVVMSSLTDAESGLMTPARDERAAAAVEEDLSTERSAMALEAMLILPDSAERSRMALRLPSPPVRHLTLLPMTWTDALLYWTTDTGLGLALDAIDLRTGSRTRQGPVADDMLALTVLNNGAMRMLHQQDGAIRVETWPERTHLFTLDDLQVAGDVSAQWVGDAVLLATRTAMWQITTSEEGIR